MYVKTEEETTEQFDCIVGFIVTSKAASRYIVWTGIKRLTDERRIDFMKQLLEFGGHHLPDNIEEEWLLRQSKFRMGRYKYLDVTTYLLNGEPKIDLDSLDWSAGSYPRDDVKIVHPE